MTHFRKQIVSRAILPLSMAVLPIVLLYSAVRTFHEVDEQRAIYLRHRVSLLVARLEQVAQWEELEQDEPYLLDLRVIERGAGDDSASLAPIWAGEELFRTEVVRENAGRLSFWQRWWSTAGADQGEIFRAHVPFHSGTGIRIARIDLSTSAANFLTEHARHNVLAASLGGLVLIVLSVYSLWAMRRTALLQVRQLELEHLAHIGKMSAVLAHEIRNPLGTIKGFVQLAGERADEATRGLLDPAVAEMQRLENLVKDLLAYGRPAAPQWKAVNWRDVARTAEHHARHLIGGRPIRFSITDGELSWRSDPGLLEQALLNLLRNAVEAIPDSMPGEIDVRSETNGGELLIRVTDSGSGIEPGMRERLFEPFVTSKASGTGLGLAITRRIANSLGGDLELRPGARGGAEAVLRIPRVRAG